MTDVPKWVERWQKERATGRSGYILRTGGSYGLAMFIAMTFFVNKPAALNTRTILISAVIWAAAGVLFGLTLWWWCERRYQKHLKSAGRNAA